MSIIIEICADSYKSVVNANKSNANRIELCSALKIGGITPSASFIKKAVEISNIPVNVLIRPRGGNFVYSDEEFDIMCQDIKISKDIGANGIVSGVLTNDGQIDIERSKKLVELSRPLEFTFHRAFDNCINQNEAIIDVINIGAIRLLTSGGFANAKKGKKAIIDLHNNYGNKIIIMPGSGVNNMNAKEFIDSGIKEIHLSASTFQKDITYKNPKLGNMGYVQKDNGAIGFNVSGVEKIDNLLKP